MAQSKPRVLLFDLEISPNIGYSWAKWEQNIIEFVKEWQILSFAWKWYGESKTQVLSQYDFKSLDDKKLTKALHDVFEEADVLVAHNGNNFDIKKANARFLYYGLKPVKGVPSIDTKLIAKKYFSFNSNSLNDLGKHLGLGEKVKHVGFDLWLGCMANKPSSWAKLKAYNVQDVELLTRIYDRFKPWVKNHPNMALMADVEGCPNCGHEEFYSDGIRYTSKRKYRRLICKKCCARFQGALVK